MYLCPNFLEYVAAIEIKMCSYLQNTFMLVNENLGNLFFLYFCQLNKS